MSSDSLSTIPKGMSIPIQYQDHSSQEPPLGMIKLSPPPLIKNSKQPLNSQKSSHKSISDWMLPLLVGTGVGVIVSQNNTPAQKMDNIPAIITGAGLCLTALFTLVGYGVLSMGGFLKEGRDFQAMFKNQ